MSSWACDLIGGKFYLMCNCGWDEGVQEAERQSGSFPVIYIYLPLTMFPLLSQHMFTLFTYRQIRLSCVVHDLMSTKKAPMGMRLGDKHQLQVIDLPSALSDTPTLAMIHVHCLYMLPKISTRTIP